MSTPTAPAEPTSAPVIDRAKVDAAIKRKQEEMVKTQLQLQFLATLKQEQAEGLEALTALASTMDAMEKAYRR